MFDKMKAMIISKHKDIIALIAIIITITYFLNYYYDLFSLDFNIPFRYLGADETSTLVEAKMVDETGWNIFTNRLAAPFGFNNAGSIISGFHNMDTFTNKLFAKITGSYVAGLNLTFVTAFYFIAIIAYIVLRNFHIKEIIAFGGSIYYSLLPFIFMRNEEHLVLSCYYFIPILVLLCIWIYEDENFLKLGSSFFEYKKNYIMLGFTLLIASSGIAYWQFFACYFLCVVAFSKFLKTKDISYVIKSLICIIMIVMFLLIGCIPELLNILSGNSGIAGRLRSIPDGELYCLKIIQLILPIRGHGIGWLEKVIEDYNTMAPCVTENASAYLGIIGVTGFVILISYLFTNKKKESEISDKLIILSELNIAAVIIGTIGGLGTCIFVFVSQTMRCFNRVSVYIAFFAVSALCLILDEKYKKTKKKYVKIIFALFTIIIFVCGVKEQNPDKGLPIEESTIKWNNDKNFISYIENNVPEKTMIYQLPYHKYPEGGVQNNMSDFELFKGYLHSGTLRWSFGISYGTNEDEWNYNTSQLSVPDMIEELKQKGFSAIYLERNGYESETEWETLEYELSEYLNVIPMVSDDKTMSCFYFGNK